MPFYNLIMVGLLATPAFVVAAAPTMAPATQPSAFDPAQHMRVDEVRPGMKGYGLTVFSGHRIERFDVNVIAVQKNFGPQEDIVLVRCLGERLEHTGVIAGMSGSPIFLSDDTGRDRMIGAIAYGWTLAKDPIAGVQPVQYMLDLPTRAVAPDTGAATTKPAVDGRRLRWSIDQAVMLPGMTRPPATYPLASWDVFAPNTAPVRPLSAGRDGRLVPLASPLMVGGLPADVLAQFAPLLGACGLTPLQAGSNTAAAPSPENANANDKPVIARGSSLAVPLAVGDLDLTALGTCTERIGDRVYGFGHPFQNEGPVALPMATGYVSTVIPTLISSFKMGGMTEVVGTLAADQSVGIAGELGAAPKMIPVDIAVSYTGAPTAERTFHFEIANHPRFTPLLGTAVLMSALTGQRQLPENHTVKLDLTMDFANGKSVRVDNTIVNTTPAELFFDIGTPVIAASQNPFQRVALSKISGRLIVSPVARAAQIIDVHVPRTTLRPGETIKAFVTYRPFRGAEQVMPIEMPVPADLPDGTYAFSVSDWSTYLSDERTNEPFRFTTENVEQVFAVLGELSGVHRDALYVRLLRQSDGVAVGRTAMPRLPASRRQVFLGAGRSNTTPFVSSTVKVVPADYVFEGQATFDIEIDRNPRSNGEGKSKAGVKPSTAPAQ
jgi:hypothetical protein